MGARADHVFRDFRKRSWATLRRLVGPCVPDFSAVPSGPERISAVLEIPRYSSGGTLRSDRRARYTHRRTFRGAWASDLPRAASAKVLPPRILSRHDRDLIVRKRGAAIEFKAISPHEC